MTQARPRRWSSESWSVPDFGCSYPPDIPQLRLGIGVVDRRGEQPGQPERGFERQHGAQELPRRGLDLAADDARVEEVLELVHADEEAERAHGNPERDREAGDDDDGVRDEV